MAHWSYSLQQIKERLRLQDRLPYPRNQVAPLRQAIDPQRNPTNQPWQDPRQPPGARVLGAVQIELAELGAIDCQKELPAVAKAGDDPSSPVQVVPAAHLETHHTKLGHVWSAWISLSSSEKYIWWDYEDSTADGRFSRERWRGALCSRSGLVNLLKHIITTSLGLITILAIALTALGKIRNHQQASDTIPDSLADNIMETQIVVVKDFDRFQHLDLAKGKYMQLDDLPQLKTGSKIPI
ncbi:hypothetical protein BGW39_005410 [Mortierella sp. 14UC]|nr:hypothetical protein BGW39_005410 [Mortierella sp. 14UC]